MQKAISVSQLSNYVTAVFDAEEMLHYIQVYGEVSGVSFVRGNVYFSLKDEGALMPCVMFGAGNISLKDGDQILATGSVRYYGKMGKINFNVTAFVPYGEGVLYQRFLELKNKLEKEGLFDNSHKLPLPKDIKKIGVCSSATGAVIHDIETVSHRRNPALNIDIYPCKVQGDGAEDTIIKALNYFEKQNDVDVIVIARGGGSLEDLMPFNAENLARAIYNCKKPVVSAVGHETDYTICDFVASIRAATPSEAAEIVAHNVNERQGVAKNTLQKLFYLMYNFLDDKRVMLDTAWEKVCFKLDKKFDGASHILELLESKLLGLNPKTILSRGYAKVFRGNENIKSVKSLAVGDNIELQFIDGKVSANITKKDGE